MPRETWAKAIAKLKAAGTLEDDFADESGLRRLGRGLNREEFLEKYLNDAVQLASDLADIRTRKPNLSTSTPLLPAPGFPEGWTYNVSFRGLDGAHRNDCYFTSPAGARYRSFPEIMREHAGTVIDKAEFTRENKKTLELFKVKAEEEVRECYGAFRAASMCSADTSIRDVPACQPRRCF